MKPSRAALLVLLLAASGCGGGGGGGGGSGGAGWNQFGVVQAVLPADGATGVDPDATIVLTFRTPMDEAPLQGGSLLLTTGGSPVSIDVTLSLTKTVATVVPRAALRPNQSYQVRLTELARRADGKAIGRPWSSDFRTAGSVGPPPPPPPSQGGSVQPVGSLAEGRSGHAAVLLADGRVAVFGGYATSSTVTDSIEIFDPLPETWTTSAAVLSLPRARLTATLLSDGRVLLAGGETGSSTDVGVATWEIWDPGLDAIASSGLLAERRTRHRALLRGDGKVLIAGGSRTDSSGAPNFARATTEIFDPSTGTSVAGPTMTVARAGHEATLLSDGRVLVTGGHGSNALSEVYDPGPNQFSSGGPMMQARRDHVTVPMTDGTVLAAGGGAFTAERWLHGENRWVQVQNMGTERSLHTAARIANGRIFIAGGERPAVGGGTTFHNSVEFYDPPTGTWLFPGMRLGVPRSGHTATMLGNGDCLVVGGKSNILNAPAVESCDRVKFQ